MILFCSRKQTMENLNEWIYLYHMKDEQALLALINYFRPMVYSIFSDHYAFLSGDEHLRSDAYNQADSLLVDCLDSYNENRSPSFVTFYRRCLYYRSINIMRSICHYYYDVDCQHLPIDQKIKEDSMSSWHQLLADPNQNVDQRVMNDLIFDTILSMLKIKDRKVLILRQCGFSAADIASILSISENRVYTSWARIKKKALELYENYSFVH